MFEQSKTLASGESISPQLRAAELTVETFAAHVPSSVGELRKTHDADGNENYWFEPAGDGKKLLFDVGQSGKLKPMCALARHLGGLGILPKISTHPQADDYASEEFWLNYANRHGIAPDALRSMSDALLKAADCRAKKALADAVEAAGGMANLRQLMGMS